MPAGVIPAGNFSVEHRADVGKRPVQGNPAGAILTPLESKERGASMAPFTRSLADSPLLLAGFGGNDLNTVINYILALLVAIDVHELGHAIVADRLGDDTPRVMGHLSLNPFRHM